MILDGQENARLIRRLLVPQGKEHVSREEYLATMAVQFVRLRPYSVLPHYFHLIDLYVANVLRYAVDSPHGVGA